MDFASSLRHAVDINLPSTIYGEGPGVMIFALS